MLWPRKTSTRCSAQAALIARTAPSDSSLVRSTPLISAPQAADSGVTSISRMSCSLTNIDSAGLPSPLQAVGATPGATGLGSAEKDAPPATPVAARGILCAVESRHHTLRDFRVVGISIPPSCRRPEAGLGHQGERPFHRRPPRAGAARPRASDRAPAPASAAWPGLALGGTSQCVVNSCLPARAGRAKVLDHLGVDPQRDLAFWILG